jgi:hypothetical protein
LACGGRRKGGVAALLRALRCTGAHRKAHLVWLKGWECAFLWSLSRCPHSAARVHVCRIACAFRISHERGTVFNAIAVEGL